jgi:hypothetical protein
MEQSVIFVELGVKHKVCLFKCALYTLNQSPRACIVVSFNSYDDKISSKVLKITIFTTTSVNPVHNAPPPLAPLLTSDRKQPLLLHGCCECSPELLAKRHPKKKR